MTVLFPTATPPMRPVAAPRSATATQGISEPIAGESVSQTQFAALMALLAGGGSRLRGELTKQLPADRAALVEQLFSQTTGREMPTTSTPQVEALVARLLAGQASGASLGTGARLDQPGDALLTMDPLRSTPSAPFVAIPRGSERPDASLARIARTRDASLEQLLAVGDEAGADAKAVLDGILAQAGTDVGARLAAGLVPTTPMMAVTSGSTSPTEPVNDLAALAPELRTKLARVIDRMKQEYGHDVQVVETARTQERQDWLFAQGRTRDGQVVTWTRDSAHTRGEAVDVKIDGGWDNLEAFAHLQQVAREEGLRTLGMKDPGHLELPRSAAAMASAASREQAPAPSANGVAPVAGVAGVAGIAGVAGVASGSTGTDLSGQFGSGARQSDTREPMQALSSESAKETARERADLPAEAAATAAPTSIPSLDREGPTMPSAAPTAPASSGREPVDGPRPAAGVQQAERVADIQQQREDAPVPTVSRLILNVDNANGSQDRITVDLRGQGVSAQISTDAASADAMRLKTADLQDSLGRHGLDTDSVRISAAGRPDGAQGDAQTFTRQDDARRESARDTQREQARARDDRQQDQERRQERARFLDYLNGTN